MVSTQGPSDKYIRIYIRIYISSAVQLNCQVEAGRHLDLKNSCKNVLLFLSFQLDVGYVYDRKGEVAFFFFIYDISIYGLRLSFWVNETKAP